MACNVVFLSFIAIGYASAQSPSIYFYSIESNVNNYSLLKIEFDTYLSKFGSYKFLPFKDNVTFEKFINSDMHGVCLLSSWHFQQLRAEALIEPFLVGRRNQANTQRYVLSASNGIRNIQKLRGERISSAGGESYTRSILSKMVAKEDAALLDTIDILVVPKDIDALMIVGFGIVKAALTTENSVAKFGEINPRQHKLLRAIATSEKVLLPLIAAPVTKGNDISHLLTVVDDMENQAEGLPRLRMLGLDGFEKLSAGQLKSLLR